MARTAKKRYGTLLFTSPGFSLLYLRLQSKYLYLIEIDKQDREYILGGEEHDEPNSDYDMLENYKTY